MPTRASLERLEAAALDGAAPGTRLEVVIEPTGPAWLPVAVFFIRRGHTVFRVSSVTATALRRFLSPHAKSNRIGASVVARLPLVDPDGVIALELPDRDSERTSDTRPADRATRHPRRAGGTTSEAAQRRMDRPSKSDVVDWDAWVPPWEE